MRNTFGLIAMGAIVALLEGCASVPGNFNGLGKDPMGTLVVYRTDGKKITSEQYQAVVEVAQEMQTQLEPQLSPTFESASFSGLLYGIAGASGGIIDGGITAGVTGTASLLGGVVNGLQNVSFAKVWIIAASTENAIRDKEAAGEEIFRRIHVEAAFVRSKNSTEFPSPNLLRHTLQR